MAYVFVCDNCGQAAGPADPEDQSAWSGVIATCRQGDRATKRRELCASCYEAGVIGLQLALARQIEG